MKGFSDYFPNGASQKQRDNFLKGLYKGKPLFEVYKTFTKRERCLYEQLSALDMLDSCFAYGGVSDFYVKKSYNHDKSYYETYLADYLKVGGKKEEFDKMLEVQKKHLARCFVKQNVYTDSEGCSYNSIVDPDEEVAV